jgi:hypothetical protein
MREWTVPRLVSLFQAHEQRSTTCSFFSGEARRSSGVGSDTLPVGPRNGLRQKCGQGIGEVVAGGMVGGFVRYQATPGCGPAALRPGGAAHGGSARPILSGWMPKCRTVLASQVSLFDRNVAVRSAKREDVRSVEERYKVDGCA